VSSTYYRLQAISEGKDLAQVTAGEIMTRGNVSVTRDTLATEIIQLLQDRHLIRVTVVDAQERLVGIVARRDILLGYLRASKPIWTF
jgi:CBS-domain-containing membrane protein